MNQVTLQQILQAREDRVELQRQFLELYRQPLVCFTMNIAGPVKISPLIRRGFQAGLEALENIRRNGLSARMKSICADLRSVSDRFPPGSFTTCISNPPYFSGGAPSHSLSTARQEGSCTPEDLFRCGSRFLKFGGDFFLVHKPERLAELITTASAFGLEAKRLCLLRHKEGASVNLILLQLRKGAKPGLLWEEIILHHADGSPTPIYREIYHI